nr:uncharacterized protein LOC127484104 [Oryctolagus cuniculus]
MPGRLSLPLRPPLQHVADGTDNGVLWLLLAHWLRLLPHAGHHPLFLPKDHPLWAECGSSLSPYSPPPCNFSSKRGKRGGRKFHAFVRAVVETSPWFLQQWRQVGWQLRAAGESIEVLKLWPLVDQALQDPTEGIELLLNEGSELQEELRQGSQASSYCNEQVRRKSKKDLESQEAYGGEEEAEEGTSSLREMPRIYPGPTRLANLTIKDESPPRYHPLVLPKFPPVKKSPFFPHEIEEEWEEEEGVMEGVGMQEEIERPRTESKQRGAVYRKPAWEQYQEPGQVFPVIQDQQGNRGWTPLDHKLKNCNNQYNCMVPMQVLHRQSLIT